MDCPNDLVVKLALHFGDSLSRYGKTMWIAAGHKLQTNSIPRRLTYYSMGLQAIEDGDADEFLRVGISFAWFCV
jgi:hypothetical protein